MGSVVKDGHLRGWFSGPDIKANACEIIHKVELAAEVCDSSYINLASSTVEEVFNLSPTISPGEKAEEKYCSSVFFITKYFFLFYPCFHRSCANQLSLSVNLLGWE